MNKIRNAGTAALACAALAVHAHEGHGMPGSSHWHATDTAGLLLVSGLIALGLWFWLGGGKK